MALTKINASVIANNTIAVGNIADNSVDATKIASNSILTRHIDDDQVTGAQLADNIDIAGTFDVTGATTLDSTLAVAGATTLTTTAAAAEMLNIVSTHASGIPILTLKGVHSAQVRYQDENGNNQARIDFNDAGQFNFLDATDGTSHLFIKNDGNVGIGTTDPKDKLHVKIGTNLNWQFGYPNSSVTTLAALNDAEGAYVEGRIDALTLNLNSQSGGNVGIGTPSPSTKLHLGGTAPGDSIIRQDSTSSGTNWEIGERAAGKWQIFEDDGDSIVATFKSDGKVGIGVTDPDGELHVESAGNADVYVERTSGAKIHLQAQSAFTAIGAASNHDLGLMTNASTRMRIDNTGRVGINRTPAITNSKLEVGGADNVPLINVEASGATAGVGIGSSRMKFYYGTAEKASIDSNGNLRTARQIIQENSDGTPRFINIPYSSAGSGFTFNWDDLANHSAVGDQSSETNAFMFEVNVTSYLFRRVKALIIVDTNSTNSIAVHTIHNSTLTCSASIPTNSEQITITIGGLWANATNYMGRITTF